MSTKYQEMFTNLERAKDEYDRLNKLSNEEAKKILSLEKEIISCDELSSVLIKGVVINCDLYTKVTYNNKEHLNCTKYEAPIDYYMLDSAIKGES